MTIAPASVLPGKLECIPHCHWQPGRLRDVHHTSHRPPGRAPSFNVTGQHSLHKEVSSALLVTFIPAEQVPQALVPLSGAQHRGRGPIPRDAEGVPPTRDSDASSRAYLVLCLGLLHRAPRHHPPRCQRQPYGTGIITAAQSVEVGLGEVGLGEVGPSVRSPHFGQGWG